MSGERLLTTKADGNKGRGQHWQKTENLIVVSAMVFPYYERILILGQKGGQKTLGGREKNSLLD